MRSAIFCANGLEECEALMVVDLLRRADIPVDIIGMNGDMITSSHNITFKADKTFEAFNKDEYEVFILPGGQPGTTNLLNNEALGKILVEKYNEDKLIAAICAAPSVLGHLGILDGKNATSFPSVRDKLGKANVLDAKCVQDDNVVTACGLGAVVEFAEVLITMIKDKEVAENVLAKIQY